MLAGALEGDELGERGIGGGECPGVGGCSDAGPGGGPGIGGGEGSGESRPGDGNDGSGRLEAWANAAEVPAAGFDGGYGIDDLDEGGIEGRGAEVEEEAAVEGDEASDDDVVGTKRRDDVVDIAGEVVIHAW